ncbi:MAG: Ammonia permease [Candidatus Methanohalarchaeum thermophilum]|uniref:Ammonia permease n=1 Tax=Methanohalarchaeum thermophilum TaxID=1903181 RepID=A0A1Q6DXL7_METT1|nr:MAG: Ammonia permease [Candidatus Methanohalarchaeum thermophilum]
MVSLLTFYSKMISKKGKDRWLNRIPGFLTGVILATFLLIPIVNAQSIVEQAWGYVRVVDIFFMTFLVAFLMMFIKKYEWEVAWMTCIVLAISFPIYVFLKAELLQQYFSVMPATPGVYLWGIAIVMSITLVIALGVPLGQLKHWQYAVLAVLFVPAFLVMEWFQWEFLEGVYDAGGSILVHMFAAFWGWGVILGLQDKRESVIEEGMKTTVTSVGWVWLAAMLLFMLWPSFVTVLLPPEEVVSTTITTYFAGFGSMITTYIVLYAIDKEIDPLIYCYAMLGGLVSIGALCDVVGIWTGFGIGLAAGVISALGFRYLADYLTRTTGVLDSMGVMQLHGICGIWGAITAIPFAGMVEVYAAVFCIVFAIISGAISGFIVRLGGRVKEPFEDSDLFPVESNRTEDTF